MIAWLLANPKTALSIVLALGLIYTSHYITAKMDEGTLAALQAKYTADMSRVAVDAAKAVADANAQAAREIENARDNADTATAAAKADLDQAVADKDKAQKDFENALAAKPPTCFDPALAALFMRSFSPSPANGPDKDRSAAGNSPAVLLRPGAAVASGADRPHRLQIDVHPPADRGGTPSH